MTSQPLFLLVAAASSVIMCLHPAESRALITGQSGNQPVQNLGWPIGSEKVANIESRLGYWEGPPFGGGEYHFLYRSDAATFNEALQIFSQIRSRRLELVVADGPSHSFWLGPQGGGQGKAATKPAESRVDWEMVLWCPRNWHRLYSSPQSLFSSREAGRFRQPVPSPQITLYIGDGQIRWEQVKVPRNVVMIDRRDQTKGLGGQVHVEVYDMATAQPAADVKVTLRQYKDGKWSEGPSGESEDEGSVKLTGIHGDGYQQLLVTAKGYAPRQLSYVWNGQADEQLHVDLAQAGKLSGVVVSTEGTPVDSVEVRASNVVGLDGLGYQMPEKAPVKTGKDGKFEIEGLPEGYVTLMCRHEGLQQKTSIHEVYEVPDNRYPSMRKEIRIEMVGTGTIGGTVVDEQGKLFTGEAHVHLETAEGAIPWGGGTRVQDGKFEFKSVPPARYRISTNSRMLTEKNAEDVETIEVKVGQTTEVKLVHRGSEVQHPRSTRPARSR